MTSEVFITYKQIIMRSLVQAMGVIRRGLGKTLRILIMLILPTNGVDRMTETTTHMRDLPSDTR